MDIWKTEPVPLWTSGKRSQFRYGHLENGASSAMDIWKTEPVPLWTSVKRSQFRQLVEPVYIGAGHTTSTQGDGDLGMSRNRVGEDWTSFLQCYMQQHSQ
ncbi:hypothetical protein BgiBS90_030164 [Biomphalaria glabrata]|nr:hypothetical protein BgiBS90_030164 [Biomphalaria glabrata]